MIHKIKIFIAAFFLLMFSMAGAQGQSVQVAGTEDMLDRLRLQELSGKSSDINQYEIILGSAFMDEEFEEGIVALVDDKLYNGEFRYDMYAEAVEFINNNLVYTLTAPRLVEYVMIGDMKLIYAPYSSKIQGKQYTYFSVEAEGMAKLLKRNQVIYREGEPAKLYQEAKPPSFVKISDSYYIRVGEETAIRVTGKKNMLEILGDKDGKISSFIKKEKISPNKEADLIKLVNYFNSIY